MAEDAPAAAQSMTREELHAEAELQMRDISQRFGALPKDKDELLGLLEDAETWLVRLDQKKTRSTPNILSPTKGVLISKDLLDHPDPDIKLAVTSCLTEVTRLTAPDAPYGDDVMKEVFQRIVDTFADLGDINSPSYERRISILDTVASVRCFILMLDLDLDHLILDIFHHLFKAVSTNHSENVIQWMETILKVLIEESDYIHSELASCLLQNLTKEAQGTLSAPFGLAERLVGLCKDRLKPVFAEILRGNPLDNYSSVVTLLCQDASNVVADNSLDASEINLAGEDKISERSAESPQETSKLEQEVNCPRQDDTRPGITPTIGISNAGALGDNNKSPYGSPSSEQKPELSSGHVQAKIEQLISGDNEILEPVTSETEKPSDVNSKKSQKCGSSGSEATEHSNAKEKESLGAAEELSPETDHGDNKQVTETGKKADDTMPAMIRKRGRPPAAKLRGKMLARMKQGPGLKSGKVDPVSDSGRRVTRQQTKEDAKSSSTKTAEGESVKKQRKSSLKLQNEDVVSDKDSDEDTSLKEVVSATETDRTKGQQENGGVSKRKCLQEAEEAPSSKKNKMLDENLVGSRIKVWWSEDKMFYTGVVELFNASSETHKVAYDDGDIEMLQLKKEIWEFTDEKQDSDPDAASDMPRGTRKGSSSRQLKGGKTGTPQSDGGNSSKKRGRPKGVRSKNNVSNADSPASSAKLKGKGAQKDTQETAKPGRRITRSIGKAKDDGVKARNINEAGSTISAEESNDKAGSEDDTSNHEVKSSEVVDGSKTNAHSTKRKLNEKEDESSEEKAPAQASTGKKHGRKSRK